MLYYHSQMMDVKISWGEMVAPLVSEWWKPGLLNDGRIRSLPKAGAPSYSHTISEVSVVCVQIDK